MSTERPETAEKFDDVTSNLQVCIFHSCDWITGKQAKQIASSIKELLFADTSVEDWGMRLSATFTDEDVTDAG